MDGERLIENEAERDLNNPERYSQNSQGS